MGLFEAIFRVPPTLTEAYALVLAAPDEKYRNWKAEAIPGKSLLPIESAAASLPAMAQASVASGQHLWARHVLRDKHNKLMGSWSLFCDVDLKTTPDAARRIAEFQPPPSYLNWSGQGYHCVWVLNQFVTDLPLLEAKQFGIAEAIGGDMQAAHLKWGPRVPGSVNWKYRTDAPPEVYTCSVLNSGTELEYDLSQFPDGSQPSKKKVLDRPSTYQEMFIKYFPDVADPSQEEWNVVCPFHEDDRPSMRVNVIKGIYICFANSCGCKGTAADFYRKMEGVTWNQAREALDHLKVKSSLIDLMEGLIRDLCTPVYRDGSTITLLSKRKDGSPGRFLSYNGGSRSSIESTLFILFDGSPAQQCLSAIGDDVPIESMNKMLIEALKQVGQSLPAREDITLLGQGIHYESGCALMVNGPDMMVWNGHQTWERVVDSPYQGRYVAYINEEDPQAWYPAQDIGTPPEPSVIAQALVDMLKHWTTTSDLDHEILALYTLYLPHWHLFGNPIHLQISGLSTSGKSSLTEGWFSGLTSESVAMTGGCIYLTNASAAGIYQSYDKYKRPLVIDEMLDHEGDRSRAVVELIRSMEGKGSPIARGTPSGQRKRYDVIFPTVWSSIKIPELMQDVNRRLHVHMVRLDPPPPNPWQCINQQWSADSLRKLSKAGTELVVSHREEVLRHYQDIQNEIKEGEGGGYRMMRRLAPLLAIARLCKMDTDALIDGFNERVREVEADTVEASPTEMLRNSLLLKPIRIPGFDGETTVSREIMMGTSHELNALHEGIYFWRKEGQLGILSSQVRLGYRDKTTPQQLGRLLKNLPGYLGSETKRAGGVCNRFAIFDVKALLENLSSGNGHDSYGNGNGKPVPIKEPSAPIKEGANT